MRHRFSLGDRVMSITIIEGKERKEFLRTGVILQAHNPVLSYCSLGSLRLLYLSLLPQVTSPSQHKANI